MVKRYHNTAKLRKTVNVTGIGHAGVLYDLLRELVDAPHFTYELLPN
jgi:hypothetical protein